MSDIITAGSRVLVVDDTPENVELLSAILDMEGFEVITANSGIAALEILEISLPDIILLDIIMPGIDGIETCKRIKQDLDWAKIPVIFLSALSDIDHKLQGFEAGGQDYITKPFQLEEVVARINTHLRLRKLEVERQVHIES